MIIKEQAVTEEQLEEFCRGHYYCDEDDGVREKWQPFEDEEDDVIEEHIDNDVSALKRFLGLK